MLKLSLSSPLNSERRRLVKTLVDVPKWALVTVNKHVPRDRVVFRVLSGGLYRQKKKKNAARRTMLSDEADVSKSIIRIFTHLNWWRANSPKKLFLK